MLVFRVFVLPTCESKRLIVKPVDSEFVVRSDCLTAVSVSIMAFTTTRPSTTFVQQRSVRHVQGSLAPFNLAVCRAQRQDTPISTTSSTFNRKQLLPGVAAAAAAALLLLHPLPAAAVSGGTSTSGIGTPLAGVDMSGQDLRKKSFIKANLRKADFSGANLTGVSLFGSLSEGAKFVGANLSFADLESGNFEQADFTNANLSGSFVNNAQFKGAKLTGTDWTDVVMGKYMQKQLCTMADGTNPTTGVDTKESLLCP